MDPAISQLLRTYEARSQREWAHMDSARDNGAPVNVDDYLLSVGPATGEFMHSLLRSARSKRVLEIGTSYGYSTTWLADAVRETGGRLVTIESHPRKQAHAREALAGVGLAGVVDFRLGDALEILLALEGPFDFVLLDLWKDLYVRCFDLFLPKLAPGAFVIADNMIFPDEARPQAEAYRRRVRDSKRLESILLPIGSGLEVSRLVA